MMNGRGKSDSSIVPMKSSNNAGLPATEAAEGRGLPKGNSPERNALRTQSRDGAPSALERVRQVAKSRKKERFTALFHHVYDVDRLRTAYRAKINAEPPFQPLPDGKPRLNARDIDDLVAFLKTLSDGYAAPHPTVTNPHGS